MRFASVLATVLALLTAGCAARHGADVLQTVAAHDSAIKTVTLYVATTRTREAPTNNVFSTDRAPRLNFARFTVSIPPDHKPAEIEWPSGTPDPKRNFAVVDQAVLTRAEFKAALAAAARTPRRDFLLYVHGYNNSFQESLFRLAQLTADSGVPGTPILFSWPSQASLTGYVADKDSVAYSRDDLVTILGDVTATPHAGRITLFGHSMGGWLTMEALRQIRLTGKTRIFNRLSQIILAAPDIDIDVFRRQMEVIGPNHPPMAVLVATDDRALALSRRISASKNRLGTLDVTDPEVRQIADKNRIQIIDITQIKAIDGANHARFVELAALMPKLAESEKRRSGTPIGQAGAFVLDAVGTTISAPFRIGSRALAN